MLWFQSRKTNCEAICESLAYLRAQVIMQDAMVCNCWKEQQTVIRYIVCKDVAWLIYFTVKKTLHACWEALLFIYSVR